MNIKTKEISGIASAIQDMRKPMQSTNDSEFGLNPDGTIFLKSLGKDDKRLFKQLAKCKSGSGHDSALKGIVVHAEFTATHDFILQLYRYSFRDTVSSESKMHMITKGGSIGDNCSKWVSDSIINYVDNLIWWYNNWDDCPTGFKFDVESKIPETKKELFECIIHNTPLGYMLTFGEVTNYLQLKTMYKQRKSHKMSGWSDVFVKWVKTLPMSYLITGEE